MLGGLVDLNNLKELEEQFPGNDEENEEEETEVMNEFQKRYLNSLQKINFFPNL